MANDKRWVRGSAWALLMLAEACGGDEQVVEDAAVEAADTAPDGAAVDLEPEADVEHDSGQQGGDSDAQAAAGAKLDVSDERIEQASVEFCTVVFECDAAMAAQQLGSRTFCPETIQGFVHDGFQLDGYKCAAAQLDSYECYAKASCEEQFSACADQSERETTVCPRSLAQ